MEKTGCKIICDAPTTLAVKGLMMMMMMMNPDKVCHRIPFTLTKSVILFLLPLQGLSSYPFHSDKVYRIISFTLTRLCKML